MKRVVAILALLAVAGAAAWMSFCRPIPEPVVQAEVTVSSIPLAAEPQPASGPVETLVDQVVKTNAAPQPVAVRQPVQPIEERGDAMLFEIQALEGTPFDSAVTMPFEGQ